MNYIAQCPAVPLADLSHFACHYPMGDPRDEGFGYCGAATKVGSRYCERHHRLCYTTSADRLGIGVTPPEIARSLVERRNASTGNTPLTVWRPRARSAARVTVSVTYEALVAAKKERDARMRTAAVDPEKEAALRKKQEEARLQAEADLKIEQEQRFWMTANAVTSFLRGAAEGVRGGPKRILIADIQRAVANYYGVGIDDIISARRTVAVVKPRQVAMYLAKMMTPKSLPEIGRRFGGRDHTTVLHAVRKIGALIETDAKMCSDVEAIRASLTGCGTVHA